jgi:DNA-directed RNA polymerase specialized sigma24 family protein
VADKNQIEWQKLRQSPSYREEICRSIYQDESLWSNVQKYVLTHGGTTTDAEEVLQESIVRFIKKLMSDESFEVEKTISSYVFGICKLTFLSNLKKSEKPISIDGANINVEDIVEVEEPLSFLQNEALYKLILDRSTDTCRQVLIYWSCNYKMTKIAELMDYKSEMMARKKKYECIQKIVDFIKTNPHLINNIMNND